MPRVSKPVLFSTFFGLPAKSLEQEGLIDPFLNVDTPLFIDPLLLSKSENPIICEEAYEHFKAHFSSFIRLLAMSERPYDAAWRGAENQIDLSEPPENGLGYGTSGRSGSSRPDRIRHAIATTGSQIVKLGSKDPEMISLMPFFESEVGPDTVSDFTTNVIGTQLAKITNDFCTKHSVPTHPNDIAPQFHLPRFFDKKGREKFVVLVPLDIVRELPIARQAADIERSIVHNSKYRGAVNPFFLALAKETIEERKEAIRHIALSSKEAFDDFLAMVKEYDTHYDPNDDVLGYYKLRDILISGLNDLPIDRKFDLAKGPSEVKRVALEALELFKHHVENGNLWEELWANGKPKRERAAQLFYFAIADAFCRANNLDISPECHMGGGPVDFKFSNGFKARVVVELKRSIGNVKHGYKTQLEIYKKAAETEIGIFVIMDFGGLGKKLAQIEAIRDSRVQQGHEASDIIVIDATRKPSASVR